MILLNTVLHTEGSSVWRTVLDHCCTTWYYMIWYFYEQEWISSKWLDKERLKNELLTLLRTYCYAVCKTNSSIDLLRNYISLGIQIKSFFSILCLICQEKMHVINKVFTVNISVVTVECIEIIICLNTLHVSRKFNRCIFFYNIHCCLFLFFIPLNIIPMTEYLPTTIELQKYSALNKYL
jgi:hypothetical protein